MSEWPYTNKSYLVNLLQCCSGSKLCQYHINIYCIIQSVSLINVEMDGKLIDFDAFNSENDISDIEVELTDLYD